MGTASTVEDTVLQTCRICGEDLPLHKFEKNQRDKSKRTNRCYRCKAKQNKKSYKAYYRLHDKFPKTGIEVEATRDEVDEMFDAFDSTCAYCGKKESEETGTFHLEHIIPLKRGGRNHLSNMLVACPSCNHSKADKPLLEFMGDKLLNDPEHSFAIWYISIFGDMSEGEARELLIADAERWRNEK